MKKIRGLNLSGSVESRKVLAYWSLTRKVRIREAGLDLIHFRSQRQILNFCLLIRRDSIICLYKTQPGKTLSTALDLSQMLSATKVIPISKKAWKNIMNISKSCTK